MELTVMDDARYMRMALELAEKGRGFTSPNPMVGAVVVKNGAVVGKGYHKFAGGAHAEVNAIDAGGELVKGGTLYVTLEPCNHTGRTPPCTEKILSAGIQRVVVAMTDPNPGVRGGGIDYLKSCGVAVQVGICQDEAERLNEAYIKYVKTAHPFVTIKCAATLDGRIATRTGDAKWVSGEASRRSVHSLRHSADAIMVGIDTIKMDDPSLTTRLEDMQGLDPRRIILDTHLSIPEEAKVLRLNSDSDTIVVTGPIKHDSAISAKRRKIEKKGVQVIEAPLKSGRIDLCALVDRLGAMVITSLLVEGGSRVIASAFASGIVDKIIFFFAPKILGGDDGVPICQGPGPALMSDCVRVSHIEVRRFGEDVMIEGYIIKNVYGNN
ncbi:bifunctional diaminohydroxyphosphoribosylaminopyrimidine deaminase/5-amino-6-(5-phosphoribosylamino)uracil reductase RibD [Thermodesulfobacteriota bacterium]